MFVEQLRNFEAMRQTISIVLLLIASTATASTWEIFSGKIGKNLSIKMRLKVDGEAVSGGYFYTKSGEEIKLAGTVTAGLHTLDEYDSSGSKTAQLVFSRSS